MEKVTIVLLVSRSEYIEQVLSLIELQDYDLSLMNLIAVVDGDNELFIKIRNLIQKTKFAEKLTVMYNGEKVNKHDYLSRRYRIADLHNYVKKYLFYADYVFMVEDDTILPRNALSKLLYDYELKPHAGFIEGVQLGRWGTPYVGAWKVDDVYDIKQITSMVKKDKTELEKIDTGGFYCVLTRFNTYYHHEFKVFKNNVLGPDFEFGSTLRQEGYENYIDWSIITTHITEDHGKINIKNTKPSIVQYNYDDKLDKWDIKEISEQEIS